MKNLIYSLIIIFSLNLFSQEAGEKALPETEQVVPQYYRGPAIEPELHDRADNQKQNFQMNPWEYYISMQRMMMQMMMTQQMVLQSSMMNIFWPQSSILPQKFGQNNAPRENNTNKVTPEIKVLPQQTQENSEVKAI